MKMRNGGMTVNDLIAMGMVVAVLVGGVVWYTNYSNRKAESARIAREKEQAEQIERERLEQERRQRDEEEFERKQLEAKLQRAREEKEREAARLAKEKSAKEAEAERLRQQAEVDAARKNYRSAQDLFAKPYCFVSEKDKLSLPFGGACSGEYWCVFSSYAEDRLIYKLTFESGSAAISVLSADSLPREMSESEFRSMFESTGAAISNGSVLWMKGAKFPGGYYKVPARDKDFRVLESNIGNMYNTYAALGMESPEMDCRVTLKLENGKVLAVLGVFDFDESVPRAKMEKAASETLGKEHGSGSFKINVERKKIRQTVVLYDGTHIKKDMHGVTHVPRTFKHLGTARNGYKRADTVETFRRQWESLRDEALRQEKRVAEAEAEYRMACEVARQKMAAKERDNARNAKSESAIDALLAKCKLFVEVRKRSNGIGAISGSVNQGMSNGSNTDNFRDEPKVSIDADLEMAKLKMNTEFVSYKCRYLKECEHCNRLAQKNGLTQSYCEQCYICKKKRLEAADKNKKLKDELKEYELLRKKINDDADMVY